MNKHIFYVAAACVALASCVKNEVRVNAPDQEITFQTVSTKAGAAFDINHKFYSYAYFLEKDKKWSSDFATAKPYINNALIAYEHGTGEGKGFWAPAAPNTYYYWPKQGSLTFFAWTDDTADPKVVGTGAGVSCAPNTGIKIENYSVKDNLNKDILVAEIAKDGKSNTSATGAWEQGVPTVFHHVLSNLAFTIKTDGNYSAGATYSLKSIKLKNINTKGNYAQGSPAATAAGNEWAATAAENVWTGHGDVKDMPVFTSAGESVSDAVVNLTTTDFIVLPQKFTDATPKTPEIEIVYTITTKYTGTDFVETVTETKPLKDIYTDGWVSGKKYTLNIKLSLNEIYWDPSVDGWDDSTVIDIPL